MEQPKMSWRPHDHVRRYVIARVEEDRVVELARVEVLDQPQCMCAACCLGKLSSPRKDKCQM
jgi:hypothetical protein